MNKPVAVMLQKIVLVQRVFVRSGQLSAETKALMQSKSTGVHSQADLGVSVCWSRPLAFLIVSAMSCGFLMSCNNYTEVREIRKTPLEHALDSAELMFFSPKSEKIIKRIIHEVLSEKDLTLKIRGLRIVSTVLLTRDRPTPFEMDSTVSYVKQALQLAVSRGDSTEWALCTVQIFRYKAMQRVWGFVDGQVEPISDLHTALRILKQHNQRDWLSYGHRVLARVMIINGGSSLDILNNELEALRQNDSAKYPIVRGRILQDIAFDYLDYFKAKTSSEGYFLRAIGILKLTDDTLSYVKALGGMARCIAEDTSRSVSYLRQAVRVSGNGLTPVSKAEVYFRIAHTFQRMGRYDSALFYHELGIRIMPRGFTDYIAYQHAVMARSYVNTGQRKRAKYWIGLHDEIFKDSFFSPYELIDVLRELADAYDAIGDVRRLTKIQGYMISFIDSVYSRENLSDLGKIENRYALELKNKEVKILQMSNELHAAATDRSTSTRFLLTIIITVTTIGVVILRTLLNRQNRLSRQLTYQKATIEWQKKNLEDGVQQLRRTQAHVLSSEKMVMLGQFTAGVAHELNNPLNFVSGGVSVLEEIVEDAGGRLEPERKILRDIRSGVDRAMHIVNSLRVFSNPRSEIGFDSHADVSECLQASLLVLQSKIRKEAVEVASDFSEQRVIGHSGQLCQVFINLIDNAIDAVKNMPRDRKSIAIRLRKERSHISIDFQDRGTGIPDSLRPNLFNAFFTTKPAGQGMGLGLFSCHTILEAIGGSISFTTQVNQGTTFTVRLERPK